jgi:two-component SAPR family response regulator
VVFEIYTLGEERLLLATKTVNIPLRRGVEVLAYFLENKAVTLKQLLAEVFPDDKPRSAKSYFHQFRHQLRENVEGLEIEYDGESKMYRLKSEIDIVWDVSELRAGRIMGKTGLFLPSSGNDWALAVDRSLDPYREAVGVLEVI